MRPNVFFEYEHLTDVLSRCKVELRVVKNKKETGEDLVHWSAADLGVCAKSRRIYEIGLGSTRASNSEFHRLIVLHELAHLRFWTSLGVQCPEGLLIAWENRVLQAVAGREAALMHLHHGYTTSSPIQRQRGQRGEHQDRSAHEFGDLREQGWWAVATEELDNMGLKEDLDKLTQKPINKRKLKSAMIRVADAQDFELPTWYEAGKRSKHE